MTATIVVVEDEGIIAMSLQEMLEEFGYRVPTIAATIAEALEAIATHRPDLLLLDIHLAGGDDGIVLAETVRQTHDLPVVFLTAHSDEPTVTRARATQPAHFLLKPFNEREVQIAIDLVLTRSESERRLRASERRFATTLHSIADGVVVTDDSGRITYFNPAAAQITGWSASEAVGRSLDEVVTAEVQGRSLGALIVEVLAKHTPLALPGDAVLTRRDGVQRQIADSIAPLVGERGQIGGAVLVFQDVTRQRAAAAERERVERKLLETQRLESLGVLAGGVAHDFNNLLAFILGYAELALAEAPEGSELSRYLTTILTGGRRAADLVRQLLAYAGQGRRQTEVVDLNRLLAEMHELIQTMIGRGTSISVLPAQEPPLVEADSVQLHQVVLNLLTNAAEALEGSSGSITIRTGSGILTADDLQTCVFGDDQPPGAYAYVQVSDTGIGMDSATLARIFDPFFTTKFTGRGLGLAAVQGILRSHHGALHVESSPGVGSTFTVFLPVCTDAPLASTTPASPPAPTKAQPAAPPARGTLLVIDDEEGVREMIARMLERLGYRAVVATSGQVALALLEAGIPDLRGVILDLTMPDMGGEAVARAIQSRRPGTPIVLTSGYSAEEAARQYHGPSLRSFLQKPFRREELEAALAAILDLPGAEDLLP